MFRYEKRGNLLRNFISVLQAECVTYAPALVLHIHVLVLKKHLSKPPIPFHGSAHEEYNDKFIELPHLYIYEEASRYHHYIC